MLCNEKYELTDIQLRYFSNWITYLAVQGWCWNRVDPGTHVPAGTSCPTAHGTSSPGIPDL